MSKAQIILIDWAGYPFSRRKELGENSFSCGLGSILDNMSRLPAGVNFEVLLIINREDAKKGALGFVKGNRWIRRLFGKPAGNSDGSYRALRRKYPFIKEIFFRDNTGYDIGAYSFGYQFLKKSGHQGDVVFMNSGLQGPFDENWLLKYKNLFYQRKNMGLAGILMDSHNTNIADKPFVPHVHSCFLYTNMDVLKRAFPENLAGSDIGNDKNRLIAEGESASVKRSSRPVTGFHALPLRISCTQKMVRGTYQPEIFDLRKNIKNTPIRYEENSQKYVRWMLMDDQAKRLKRLRYNVGRILNTFEYW